jgi:uncharacterized membrane protein
MVTALSSIVAKRRIFMATARCLAAAAMLLPTFAGAARADFRVCNNTGSRVGVAIGYKDRVGWATEGWWNLAARTCETILRGALVARYYYLYAVDYDRGGEWTGHSFMCSREKEFTIRGKDNCLARGYDLTGFREVDTGEQRTWTVQLTDAVEKGPGRPMLPLGPLPAPPSAVTAPPSAVTAPPAAVTAPPATPTVPLPPTPPPQGTAK